MSKEKVLIVEDDISISAVFSEYLKAEGLDSVSVETGEDGIAKLNEDHFDAVILDLNLPDMSGFDVLPKIREADLSTSVVVVTSEGSVTKAVDAMRLGAYDFVLKPCSKERLVTTVKNAIEHTDLRETVEVIRDELGRDRFYGFIGKSLKMQGVYRIIESVSGSRATVFITGESGTGKEVCAEAIHKAGPRSKKPFIPLNCGAIPKDLIESELFGHVKGSFTGAISDRDGAAKKADGGTLFLDEICEMDPAAQTKLLRFLQTETIQPVGRAEPLPVDVRVVCATNKDPRAEVAAGRFREDLFYRLHVVPLSLPALRDREDDCLELCQYFLERYSAEESKNFTGFDANVEAFFQTYSWPGNVRELQNMVRNIVVLHDGPTVTMEMLPLDALESPAPVEESSTPTAPLTAVTAAAQVPNTAGLTLAQIERNAIEAAIVAAGGSVPKAAKALDVSPSTLYRKREAWEAAEGGWRRIIERQLNQ